MSIIKKNFFYNILLSVSQALFPLVTFSYLARVIHIDGIGIVSFVESICRYAILLAALGIPVYGIREVAKHRNDKYKLSQLCSELILIHFITTLLIIFIYALLVFTIDKFHQDISFYILGIPMILSNVFLIEWYFQGIGDFKFITLRTLAIRTLMTVCVLFLINDSNDGIYYFLLTVLMSVLNAIVNLWYAKKTLNLSFNVKWEDIKKHLKPLLLIFSTTLSISIYILLDTIMLGFLADEKAVGFYTTSLRISKIPMLFVGALGTVLLPHLAHSFGQNDISEFKRLISNSINFVVTFSFPIIFLFLSLSKEIITVFAGVEFLEANTTLQILSGIVFFIGISNIFGLQILTPMGKDKYLTISVLIGTLTSVLLNYFLIPIFQEKGAAISIITTECFVAIITFYFASKFIELKINYRLVIKTFFVCSPIYFFSKIFHYLTANSFLILISTLILTGIYFLTIQLYLLKNEMIIELYKKLKKR